MQDNERITEAINFSQKLIQWLQEYYEKTLKIKTLLDGQSDKESDSIFEVEKLLNQRDKIIEDYNQLNTEYNHLVSGISQLNSEEVTKSKENFRREFEEKRKQFLTAIEEADQYNFGKLKAFYNDGREKVRQISIGRKLHDAYQGMQPISNGIYIDKKK